MQISTAYSSTSLSLASQTFRAAVTTGDGASQPPAMTDNVEVSDKALQSSQKLGRQSGPEADGTLKLIHDLLGMVLGKDFQKVEALPAAGSADASPSSLTAGYQEVSLSAQHISLSVSGSISTRDGKELGFSLDLQYDHASVSAQSAQLQAGQDGLQLGYAGFAADLTSTDFSFSLSSAGDSGASAGKGSFRLNDDISRIGKELKPLVKEFMEAAGTNGGWGEVNRFLRSVA